MSQSPTTDAVIDEIYREVRRWPEDAALSDRVERAHQAICLYLERAERAPFPTATDAVAWIWATYRNLGMWERPSRDFPLTVMPGSEPAVYDEYRLEPVPSPASEESADPHPDASQAAEVILRYFASGAAAHSGRLSLTSAESQVVRSVATYGLSDADYRVSTDAYHLMSQELDMTPAQVKRTYYSAKQAFVRVYYIVGALGAGMALTCEQALGEAIAQFRARFRGQNDWSVLAYAARSTVPCEGYARVEPDLYDESIVTNPEQARRLGWNPDGPRPALLLHDIEHRAAKAFGQDHPHCVLSSPPRCPLCGCQSEGKRHE